MFPADRFGFMVMLSARKRLESIERSVIPSMFVGVLSKDDSWFKYTLDVTLPKLKIKTLQLAKECIRTGECEVNDTLCDEARINSLFEETRSKLMQEHLTRERHSRFYH